MRYIMSRYDDIIFHRHSISPKHPRMTRESRAAQFAPFAALTGYDEAIEDAAFSFIFDPDDPPCICAEDEYETDQ